MVCGRLWMFARGPFRGLVRVCGSHAVCSHDEQLKDSHNFRSLESPRPPDCTVVETSFDCLWGGIFPLRRLLRPSEGGQFWGNDPDLTGMRAPSAFPPPMSTLDGMNQRDTPYKVIDHSCISPGLHRKHMGISEVRHPALRHGCCWGRGGRCGEGATSPKLVLGEQQSEATQVSHKHISIWSKCSNLKCGAFLRLR